MARAHPSFAAPLSVPSRRLRSPSLCPAAGSSPAPTLTPSSSATPPPPPPSSSSSDMPNRASAPRITPADPILPSMLPHADAPADSNGFGNSLTVDEIMQSLHGVEDPIWHLMRREADTAASSEPQLASSLYADVLVHDSLEETLATVLGNALHTETFQATQWVGLFRDAMAAQPAFGQAVRADISAFMQRDPASSHAVRVVLYSKGFHALQSWRLSSWLWHSRRTSLALFLQSMISSRFAVDIHPAASIGSGVLIDHGTGIVIGETAAVGNNVSILHNVTLGGTGKESGDRHPKVADGVMIGAGATILGNIVVGTCAHVAACSVVLKPVDPFSVVSGVPAKVVGKVRYDAGVMPSFVMDQRLSLEVVGAQNQYQHVVTGSVKGTQVEDSDRDVGGGV